MTSAESKATNSRIISRALAFVEALVELSPFSTNGDIMAGLNLCCYEGIRIGETSPHSYFKLVVGSAHSKKASKEHNAASSTAAFGSTGAFLMWSK